VRRLGVALAVTATLASGCGLQLEDVPMPRLVSGPTYHLDLRFDDALNLPTGAPVKLAGATVGQVSRVEVQDYTAEVQVEIADDVRLHASSRAELRLTSPMGTSFIELTDGSTGALLREGDDIDTGRTSEAPDVTDLMSALSTVVTGGSFGDISTIIRELNAALTGNGGTVHSLLTRLDTSVTGLDRELPTLDRLTASLDRLTTRLKADLPGITASLTDLSGLVTTLESQRTKMMGALASLRRFELQATPFTAATRTDLLTNLGSMRSVLQTLLGLRGDISGTLKGLVAFAEKGDEAAPGDFVNFDLTFLGDLGSLLHVETGNPAPPSPRSTR
jgi:phospholipid/cholesterol/gamma-HCH transport system substrate-binding protein